MPEDVGGSGDPTPVSAYGVYMGMKACAKELWGMDSLAGKTVAVQGIGNVGEKLVKLLSEEDARIYLCDLDEERAAQVAVRSEEHTSELQTLMRISYAAFCLKKKQDKNEN